MKLNIVSTFEEIYEKESDTIFRFCVLRVSDREQALDITQETFVRFWQSLGKGETIENPRAFLFTITRRLIIDWYRKKKSLSLESLSYGEDETSYDPPDEATMNNLEVGPEGRYLLTKLEELSPVHRDPITLRFIEGLTPGEIGEVLGISTNAASVRINRALGELRKITGYTIKDLENE